MQNPGESEIKALLTTPSEARSFYLLDTPFLLILTYMVVVYCVIYFIAVYGGPLVFGTPPYPPYQYGPPGPGPYPYYRREFSENHALVKRGIQGYNEHEQNLIARVDEAVHMKY